MKSLNETFNNILFIEAVLSAPKCLIITKKIYLAKSNNNVLGWTTWASASKAKADEIVDKDTICILTHLYSGKETGYNYVGTVPLSGFNKTIHPEFTITDIQRLIEENAIKILVK